MKLTKTLPFALLLILLSAAASAQLDPAPTASITASPGTTATNSATIRVSARDSGANAGISHIDFYINGIFDTTKQCGFSTSCILSRTRTAAAPKTESYYAIVHDMSQSIQTSTLTVIFLGPNTPPNVTLPNRSINEDSGNNANLTDLWAYVIDNWTNSSSLTYSLVNQTNNTVANCIINNNRWISCSTPTQDAFGTSIITITASDGQLTGTGNFTLTVLPVNDPPVFNASTPIPAITFAEDTNYTFNISDYFYDVDNAVSSLSFLPASIGNITITYNYILAINKVQATLTPAPDWNGAITINFTASDGALSSGASNTVTITVTNVNDAPQFVLNSFNCGHMYTNISFSCDINATDIDTGDILTFYDNSTLFNIDLTTGWLNFTPNTTGNYSALLTVCDDSGAANNCTSIILQFTIYPNPTVLFMSRIATPSSPVTYNPNSTYQFKVEAAVAYQWGVPHGQEYMGQIWLEFNGTNYTTSIMYDQYSHAWYYVNFTTIAAGNYTYRWHGNLTPSGLHFKTPWINYLVNKANPGLMLNIPGNWTYGTPANVSCTINTTQATPVLTRNGTAVPNPDSTLLGAGTYAYFCSVPQTQNYTAANASGGFTVNPATVTTQLTLITPITYGTAANITCSASTTAVTPALARNNVLLSGLTDTAILGAGTYNYTCYYNTTQNYTGDTKTQQLIINKAQSYINLTLNGTDGDIFLPINGSVINVTATPITPAGGYIELYINGTLAASGTGTQSVLYNFSTGGAYPVTAVYNATQNYTQSSRTYYAAVGIALAKININPPTGTSLNSSSFTLSFNTNQNTTCRWSLTDQAYSTMTNTFATTGQTAHSGTITGLVLGSNGVHIACTNETAASNTDLTYFVQNIIEQGSTLTNGATANNSILYSTSLDNSALQSTNATNSAFIGSTVNGSSFINCTIINSTVKNYHGRNCRIVNAFLDPNPPYYIENTLVTGGNILYSHLNRSISYYSNITNSTVFDSNSQYSSLNNSNVTQNSYISRSTLNGCGANNANMQYSICQNSNITNSQLYNITLINATVNNGVMTSGILILPNGTPVTAPPNVVIANITNLPPNAAFTYTPASPRRSQNINFNAGSSTDPNPGDTLTYSWNFGDASANRTGVATTYAYTSTGTYNVTLVVTDSFGLQDTSIRQITVTAAPAGGTTGSGGGGGGGGGGGSAFYARNWNIDLDTRETEIRTLTRVDQAVITVNNQAYTLRMKSIDRTHINFTIQETPYSLINYEIKKIDLDNDGMSDMRVIILNNYYTRAQIRFDKFVEPMQTTAPILFSNLTWGLDEPETQEEITIEADITAEQKEPEPAAEPEAPVEEEKEAKTWKDMIPKDSRVIGIGITIAVVLIGLIVYFIFSLLF